MPAPPDVLQSFHLEDTAERPDAPPVQVKAARRHGWPELHVCGPDGRAHGLVTLDYHDGRLRVLVYDLTCSEEPKAAVLLAETAPPTLEQFLTGEPVAS